MEILERGVAKMKLDMKHFVLTVTLFIAIVYLICAIAIYLAPESTLRFFSYWMHGVDLMKIAKIPTIVDISTGLVTALIVSIVGSALFAGLWNYFDEKFGGQK